MGERHANVHSEHEGIEGAKSHRVSKMLDRKVRFAEIRPDPAAGKPRRQWKHREADMKRRILGTQGLNVLALGLGCMGMTGAYGVSDEAEAIATIHEAIDLGIDSLDTAEFYGAYENERLLGWAVRGRRDRAVIATKFGFTVGGSGRHSVSTAVHNTSRTCATKASRDLASITSTSSIRPC